MLPDSSRTAFVWPRRRWKPTWGEGITHRSAEGVVMFEEALLASSAILMCSLRAGPYPRSPGARGTQLRPTGKDSHRKSRQVCNYLSEYPALASFTSISGHQQRAISSSLRQAVVATAEVVGPIGSNAPTLMAWLCELLEIWVVRRNPSSGLETTLKEP